MKRKMQYVKEYLTIANLRDLKNTIDNTRDECMIFVGIDTALRINDLLQIQIKDIDFEENMIPVYQHKKDNVLRVILEPTTSILIKKYIRQYKPKKYLFENTKTGKPFHYWNLEIILKKWCKEIGIDKHISWHVLRRTYVNISKKYGRDIEEVCEQTGDSIATIKKYYEKYTYEDHKEEHQKKPILGDL